MKKMYVPLLAALLVLLAVPAVFAAESGDEEVSVVLKENGVRYLLYVPKGYRQVLESSPENAFFADVRRNLSTSGGVLGIFVEEETLHSISKNETPQRLKYFAVSVPKQALQVKLSAKDFAELKRTLQGQAGRDALKRGVNKAQAQLGEKVEVRNMEVYDSPDQYALTSMRLKQSSGGELGVVTAFSVQDARLVTYYFYESLDAPDTMQSLAREAGAYAQRYIDAGKATFEAKAAPQVKIPPTSIPQGANFQKKLPPPPVVKENSGPGVRSIVEWIAIGTIAYVLFGAVRRWRKSAAAQKAPQAGAAPQGADAEGRTPGA